MADKKITELNALTATASADLLHVIDDNGGTPINKKMTISNFFNAVPVPLNVTDTTAASNTSTASVIISGGVSIDKNVIVTGNTELTGNVTFTNSTMLITQSNSTNQAISTSATLTVTNDTAASYTNSSTYSASTKINGGAIIDKNVILGASFDAVTLNEIEVRGDAAIVINDELVIASNTSQSLAFFGGTPTTQPSAIADANSTNSHTKLNSLLSALRDLGLIAST